MGVYIYAGILLVLKRFRFFPIFCHPFVSNRSISLSLNTVPEEKKLSASVLSITPSDKRKIAGRLKESDDQRGCVSLED
jgi:hypothetical protein